MKLLLTATLVLCMSPALKGTSAEPVPETDKRNPVRIELCGPGGQPIQGCKVDVMLWKGYFQDIGIGCESDQYGLAILTGLPVDGHLNARVMKAGFVTEMLALQADHDNEKTLSVKLERPVYGKIEVADASGQPVVGAELSTIKYSSRNGGGNLITKARAGAYGIDWPKSDQSGVLELPPLPGNTRMTVVLVHPEFAPSSLDDLRSDSGVLASVALHPGAGMTLRITKPDGTPLDRDESLDVTLFPSVGAIAADGMSHTFQPQDGQVRFTVHASEYTELRVRSDRYFIGPLVVNRIGQPNPVLDRQKGDSQTISLTAYPRQKLTGRVVDAQGQPIPDVSISALLFSDDIADAEQKLDQLGSLTLVPITSLGSGETDADGRYELEVAAGAVHLEPIANGYFAKEQALLIGVPPGPIDEKDGSIQARDMVLSRVPKLAGRVRNEAGEAMPGMICRLMTRGYGSAMPVAASDQTGKFQLSLNRIPYQRDWNGLDFEVFVIAFHPQERLGGIATVDLRDDDALGNIELTLASVPLGWTLDPLDDKAGKSSETTNQNDAERESLRQRRAESLSAGIPGQAPPDLSEGIWLHSDATSLTDLRGKFVLLDFWFIGCGPCHREQPILSLANNVFDPNKFAIVGVHTNMSSVDEVRAFCKREEIHYATVVDGPDGEITRNYRSLGVEGYPSYLLIDPAGKIVINDAMIPEHSLRQKKLELIHDHIMNWTW